MTSGRYLLIVTLIFPMLVISVGCSFKKDGGKNSNSVVFKINDLKIQKSLCAKESIEDDQHLLESDLREQIENICLAWGRLKALPIEDLKLTSNRDAFVALVLSVDKISRNSWMLTQSQIVLADLISWINDASEAKPEILLPQVFAINNLNKKQNYNFHYLKNSLLKSDLSLLLMDAWALNRDESSLYMDAIKRETQSQVCSEDTLLKTLKNYKKIDTKISHLFEICQVKQSASDTLIKRSESSEIFSSSEVEAFQSMLKSGQLTNDDVISVLGYPLILRAINKEDVNLFTLLSSYTSEAPSHVLSYIAYAEKMGYKALDFISKVNPNVIQQLLTSEELEHLFRFGNASKVVDVITAINALPNKRQTEEIAVLVGDLISSSVDRGQLILSVLKMLKKDLDQSRYVKTPYQAGLFDLEVSAILRGIRKSFDILNALGPNGQSNNLIRLSLSGQRLKTQTIRDDLKVPGVGYYISTGLFKKVVAKVKGITDENSYDCTSKVVISDEKVFNLSAELTESFLLGTIDVDRVFECDIKNGTGLCGDFEVQKRNLIEILFAFKNKLNEVVK